MAGDEQTDSSGKYGMNGSRNEPRGAAKYWPPIFKVAELLLCILCIALIDEPANNSRIRVFVLQRTVGLAYATFSTFVILTSVYLIGKIVKDSWPWKTSALLSLIATILFVTCAGAILNDWVDTKERNYWPPNTQRFRGCELLHPEVHNSTNILDLVCATGFVSVIAAIVFLIDLLLTLRSGARGDLGN